MCWHLSPSELSAVQIHLISVLTTQLLIKFLNDRTPKARFF